MPTSSYPARLLSYRISNQMFARQRVRAHWTCEPRLRLGRGSRTWRSFSVLQLPPPTPLFIRPTFKSRRPIAGFINILCVDGGVSSTNMFGGPDMLCVSIGPEWPYIQVSLSLRKLTLQGLRCRDECG